MIEPRKTIDPDGAQALVLAIVQQAVTDYRSANECSTERREIERFFRSTYFEQLTGLDGKQILKRLNQPKGGAKRK